MTGILTDNEKVQCNLCVHARAVINNNNNKIYSILTKVRDFSAQ